MEAELMIKIGERVSKGEKAALVTLTSVDGSSPGREGNMMAVFEDGTIMGTVGGGNLEFTLLNDAKKAMEENENKNLEFKLSKEGNLGMECGGTIKAFIKVFKKKDKVVIIGGGHVGSAVYNLAQATDFLTIILDDREEFCNKIKFPEAFQLLCGNVTENMQKLILDESCYVVIVSRGHQWDHEALREALKQSPKYIGVIGSTRKLSVIFKDLQEEGFDLEKLKNVYAPTGLDVADDFPKEIAVGILAEILMVKNNKSGISMRDVKKVIR